MTRILFTLLITTTLTMTTLSQNLNQPETSQACNLSPSQAPVIRGIRLGMKPDEWLKLFPGSAQDERIKAILDMPPMYPEYGLNRIAFESPSSSESWGGAFRILPKEEFPGIDRVYLTLFDNQIVQLQIHYSPNYANGKQQPLWDDISQLVAIFSETFNLPTILDWEKRTSQQAVLKCSGFELELKIPTSMSAQAELRSKSNIEPLIRQRAKAEMEKGRASFKP